MSISHGHSHLVVSIARHNDRATYILLLLGFTSGFVFFCYFLLPPLFKHPFSTDVFYVLPFLAFVVLWYLGGLRIGMWRAFGIEHITIEAGVLHWTRTALFWVRKVEIPIKDINEVRAITPWHGLSNRVSITTHKDRYTIGDMLLRDETKELADRLRNAVGVRG